MQILAIVPARAGSTRLPNKNVRVLLGQPLVIWSLAIMRPGHGIPLVSLDVVTGRALRSDLAAGATLQWADIQ